MAWPKGKARKAEKPKIANLTVGTEITPLERFIGGIEEADLPKVHAPVVATGSYQVTSYARTEPDGIAWQVERKGFLPDQGFDSQEAAETYASLIYG
jgi:hypothetical protein